MTAINTRGFAKTNMQPAHGALAVARLGQTMATIPQEAAALGFSEVAPHQFRHPDGSWVKLTKTTVQIGFQREILVGTAASLIRLPAIAVKDVPASAAARKVAAGLPFGSVEKYRTQLGAAGFVQILPNYYSHPDGSWAAIIDGAGVRGFGAQRIGGMPGTLQATETVLQQAQQGLSIQGSGLDAQSAVALPASPPTFADGFLACAQAPYMRDATGTRALGRLGLVRKSAGFWEAPDGSWFAQTASRFERGHLQRRFQGNPIAIDRMLQRPPGAGDLALAVGYPGVARLSAAQVGAGDPVLNSAGFTPLRPGVFTHSDGSFVAALGDKVRFGAAGQVLTAAPELRALPVSPVTGQAMAQWQALWNHAGAGGDALRHALMAAGFQETRPGFLQQGAQWVAIEGDQRRFGDANGCYDVLPSPAALPQSKPTVDHSWLAIVQTGAVASDTRAAAAKLTKLGFAKDAPGFYSHPDGSWIAISGQEVTRGFGGLVLTALPKAPKKGSYRIYQTLPSTSDWGWYQTNTALGRTPLIGDNASARRTLAGLGYQKKSDKRWEHPDGSYVAFEGGGVRLGWQKWKLGDLPYNNRVAGY